MSRLLEVGELLVASWLLANNGPAIPTSQGVLDLALRKAKERSVFPGWVWDELHFASGRVGLQCIELPDMLNWAQRALLTTAPNPSYETTSIRVSKQAALRLVRSRSITEENASEWGRALMACVKEAQNEMSEFGASAVEEY